MDQFKVLKGYPGYRVRESGVVESRRKGEWQVLTGHRRRRGGYVGFRLRDESGRYRYRYLHNLVMMAFRGPTPEGLEICFRNGRRDDCRLENLHFSKADRRRKKPRLESVTRGVG
jgi:hypothetical protein